MLSEKSTYANFGNSDGLRVSSRLMPIEQFAADAPVFASTLKRFYNGTVVRMTSSLQSTAKDEVSERSSTAQPMNKRATLWPARINQFNTWQLR